MKLSIIIPVFNEEKSILIVLRKVKSVTISNVIKEIIVVDDGSTDNTRQIVEAYIAKQTAVKILFLTHKVNQGKGAAVITGIEHASGHYIIIQDADTEYDPEDIVKLMQPILRGETQVVYGTRLNRLPHFSNEEKKAIFIFHYIGNRFLSFITSILYKQWLTDMETCYKIFPLIAVNGMKLTSRGFEFEPEITAKLLKRGYSITEIPITTKPRGYSEGKKLNAVKEGPKALWILIKYRFMN